MCDTCKASRFRQGDCETILDYYRPRRLSIVAVESSDQLSQVCSFCQCGKAGPRKWVSTIADNWPIAGDILYHRVCVPCFDQIRAESL